MASEKAPRLVEVRLLKDYVPANDTAEITTKIPAGSVIKFPGSEAARLLKLKIAEATENTFGSIEE